MPPSKKKPADEKPVVWYLIHMSSAPTISLTTHLPTDKLPCVSEYLTVADVLRFSRVSPYTHTTLDKERAAAKKAIVLEHYRAAADCSVQGITKYPGQPIFKGQLPTETYPSFAFFINEAGRLTFCFSTRDLTSEQRWAYRDAFDAGQIHRPIVKKIEELFRYQALVLEELASQPFNEARPLQDLRDRIRQVEVIEQEGKTLKWALSFCCRFEELEKPIVKPPAPPKSKAFLHDLSNLPIFLAETKIVIGMEAVPIAISALLSFDGAMTKFSIHRVTSSKLSKCLGTFVVEKTWKDPDCFIRTREGRGIDRSLAVVL